MKRVPFLLSFFLFLFCFLLGFSIRLSTAEIDEKSESYEIIKINSAQSVSYFYLFPILKDSFKDVSQTEFEGYKFFLRSYVNILREKYYAKLKDVDGAFLSDTVEFSDYDSIGFLMTLNSAHAATGVFETKEVEGEKSGLFVTKTKYKIDFPFSKESADMFRLLTMQSIASWQEAFGVSDSVAKQIESDYQSVQFVYEMISPSQAIKSENFFEKNKLYYNVFSRSYEELDEKIEVYVSEINRGAWYLSALFAVLLVVVPLEIILNLKKKKF